MADVRRDAVRALTRFSRVLERSAGDLTLTHYRLLAAVDDGDERASRLAARLALGKPTVSAAVEALTARGLLERRRVPEDHRAVALSLTDAGRAALASFETLAAAGLDEVVARTGDPERVWSSLADLAPALDRLATDRAAQRGAVAEGAR